jgi:hypothetical protein
LCYNHVMFKENKFPESREQKKDDKKEKIIKELNSIAEKTGNKFNFIEEGEGLELSVENVVIKKELLDKFNEEDKDTVEVSLKVFKYYLSGPLFTDSFGENNLARRDWQKKFEKIASEEVQKFYEKNRLTMNSATAPEGLLRFLKNQISDPSLKAKLSELEDQIPKEFSETNEQGKTVYNCLVDDKEKIKIMKSFGLLIHKVVSVLEDQENKEK